MNTLTTAVRTDTDQPLLDAVATGHCTPAAIAQRLGVSVADVLKRLVEPGFVAALERLDRTLELLERQSLRLRHMGAIGALDKALPAAEASISETRRIATSILRFKPLPTREKPLPDSGKSLSDAEVDAILATYLPAAQPHPSTQPAAAKPTPPGPSTITPSAHKPPIPIRPNAPAQTLLARAGAA